jgi:multidrug transporter EmrE-like cation transporter
LAQRDPAKARRIALALVCVCTVVGAAAQLLMKTGTQASSAPDGAIELFLFALTNPRLFAGYALYGLSTILLTLALKYGELSLVYPVIALTYVWVTALSVLVFGESVNPWKLAGLATVVIGVAVLGKASGK